jgi:hypothetical protein
VNFLSESFTATFNVPSRSSHILMSKRRKPRRINGSLRMNSAAFTSLSVKSTVMPSPTIWPCLMIGPDINIWSSWAAM